MSLSVLLDGTSSTILLDPQIRDWVLLPIFLVMFMQGLLRAYMTNWMRDDKTPTVDAITKTQLLRRSQRLRGNALWLSPAAWKMRRKFFMTKGLEEAPKSAEEQAAEQDPLAMVGMMKQNMMNMVPNMLMMGWVSYFFSGFVLVKLPFPLTDRFKSMLQRGIMLNSLDVSYVSSLSWFFINLFGLRGLFSLVLGAESSAMDNPEMMQMQMQMQAMGMGGPGGPQDMGKIFAAEKNELEITHHDFVIPYAEQRLLKMPIPA